MTSNQALPYGATQPKQRIPHWGKKAMAIGAVVFGLKILMWNIEGTAEDRAGRLESAGSSVRDSWGGETHFGIAFAQIPVRKISLRQKKDGSISRSDPWTVSRGFAASTMSATVQTHHSKRTIGLFPVPVYEATVDWHAQFKIEMDPSDNTNTSEILSSILWNQSDVKFYLPASIQDDAVVKVNGKPSRLIARGGDSWDAASSGNLLAYEVPLPNVSNGATIDVSIHFVARGTKALEFRPAAKQATLDIQSDWPNPSFSGVLPKSHDIGSKGFTAKWVLAHVGGVPFSGAKPDVRARSRIQFIETTGIYVLTDRILKYWLLVVFMTFSALFLIEARTGRSLSFLNYGLVGSALVIFYLLVLSLSEHTGFGVAYLCGAVAVLVMILGYCRSILPTRKSASGVTALVAGIYGYLYVVLNLEDFALVAGAVGLYVILAVLMYFTLKIRLTTSPVAGPDIDTPAAT